MKLVSFSLGATIAAALSIPMSDVVHEKRGSMPGYMLKRSPTADTIVPVRIALKQSNLEKGMDFLMDVSDPDSKNYSRHYTRDQVAEMFSPTQESIDTVKGWLQFRATVGQLESLLQTQYHLYENKETRSEHLGTEGYTLPAAVSEHVDFIMPGVAMLKKRSMLSRPPERPFQLLHPAGMMPEVARGCDILITPDCIKAMYNITTGTLSDASNRLGIFQEGNETHRQSDLDSFYKYFAADVPDGFGPKIDLIDWGSSHPNPDSAVGEAAIDLQSSIPIIYPQSAEVYQTHSNYDGVSHTGFLNQFLDAVDAPYCTYEGGDDPIVDGTTPDQMCGAFTPTHVVSVSYDLTEVFWPAKYLQRQCDEFMKLGLQGTSIVFASGDSGVAGSGKCLGNGTIFNPPTPVSCPYTTAVGGTYLSRGSKPGDPESATASFASGGGFSNIWTTPDYQKDAVANFFLQHDPGFPSYNTSGGTVPTSGGIYNRGGRGFPDVSAVGDNGVFVIEGWIVKGGGTSMAAPIFAAILTRINEERIHAGKRPVGFANPAFYKNPAMFNDITIGDQLEGRGGCNGKAFSTAPGWDPVTGLGTPNYPAMLSYFLSLP